MNDQRSGGECWSQFNQWFGPEVVWGGAEGIVLLLVFYGLTKETEQWRREVNEWKSEQGREGAVEKVSE